MPEGTDTNEPRTKKPLIAVVAASGIFPNALGTSAFWRTIVNKTDATQNVEVERWVAPLDWVHDPQPQLDKAYAKRACFVQPFKFPSDGYDLPSDLLQELDPLHQWTLHTARQALQSAKMASVDHSRTGIILAAIALPTDLTSSLSRRLLNHQFLQPPQINSGSEWLSSGSALSSRVVSMPAAIVARAFGLGGGSYTLDAACASSLYAVQLACDALQSYRSDAMLAGGVSGPDSLYTQVGFSQLKALSPSGRCAPFDHSANGLVVGEGVGMVLLKRLDDAMQSKDTILGVIHGIGLSNDMRGNLLAPESAGQLRAMQMAYHHAQWHPQDVDYIECHGAGTPVGDTTELQSLRLLWGEQGWQPKQCAIGSVKSVVGHLLTAAGAAGLIKTLLAFQHKTLPPSLKFEAPKPDSPLVDGPFYVQTDPAPWKRRNDSPRRAAVSAFGFGGINAHVLLEQHLPEAESSAPIEVSDSTQDKRQKDEDVAIVGLELCLGNLDNLSEFQKAILNGREALTPVPATRWKAPLLSQQLLNHRISKGGFIEEVVVEMGEFLIPPGEIPQILPQQLLMLKVAAGAMESAGLPLRAMRERMGAIIGIGFDYEACNFDLRWSLPTLISQWVKNHKDTIDAHRLDRWLAEAKADCGPPLNATRTLGALGGIVASRIAREFRLGGPSFVVSAEEVSGLRALEIGTRMLQSDRLDAVLVGAVDLFCDERNLATLSTRLKFSANGSVRPFDQHADGTLPGEGAVAVVLKRLSDARADKDRIFAIVNGFGSASGGGLGQPAPLVSTYASSLNHALDSAHVSPSAIGLMETHGSGIPAQDQVEAEAMQSAFASGKIPTEKRTAIGTLKPLVGHTGAVSGLASLAKAAISLQQRMIPPTHNYALPALEGWETSPLYMPRETAFWLRNSSQGPRHACVGGMTTDGNCMHVVLQEPPVSSEADMDQKRPMGSLPLGLFCLSGQTPDELLKDLNHLESLANQRTNVSMEELAHTWYQQNQNASSSPHNLSIVAKASEQLHELIAKGRHAVSNMASSAFGGNGGLCFMPHIHGQPNQVAFVYPGSGNHYIGMGQTLGAHWPDVLHAMDATTDKLKSQMIPQWYHPWHSQWPENWQKAAYQTLTEDPLRPIFGQVLFGGHMTALLQRFGLRPHAVLGYSLGESTSLFAVGAWPDRGEMLDRLASSDLFRDKLAGPCIALRQAWQLEDHVPVHWRAAVVNRSKKRVDEALIQLPHVRRLIVNTPNQCVIGGLHEAVETAITRLQCEAVYLDGVVTVHCDAAQPVATAYRNLHCFDTTPVQDIRFYSCSYEGAYDVSRDASADSILHQALHGFDFPKTIEQAYADGVRLFLEVGPHASCTNMIGQILKEKPHVAVAANHREEDECLTLIKCLGTMAAVGTAVDLAPLYGYTHRESHPTRETSADAIRVPVGNGPLTVRPLPKSQATEVPLVDPIAEKEITGHSPPPPIQADAPATSKQTALDIQKILNELDSNVAATAKAHQDFLDLTRDITQQFSQALALQNDLAAAMAEAGLSVPPPNQDNMPATEPAVDPSAQQGISGVAFDRSACMEFAIGSVGKMLGPQFDIIDTYPVRVRLPDEPLMLVDRILTVEGEMLSLSSGRVVTEHDVLANAWYLDGDRAPVCIAVEAGQADLFLSAYLGIDHQVKGGRAYRLLDASICFHRGLPRPGETIRYDIHIDKFVRQEDTYLFFFRFEGHIGKEHLITMTQGCAGFFTAEEVRNSGGIILTDEDLEPGAHIDGTAYSPLLPLANESYDEDQINTLRQGDPASCFGTAFKGIHLPQNLRLPGTRMALINRILTLEPQGGRFGRGYIKAEADIHPDDWFLTCHFVDDMVMPGTLMYECCAHTLRVLLLRMGWVTDNPQVSYEPIQEIPCRLKCRGPVTPQTRHVHYAVEIKEMGYHPEPYVIADAHMYADDHYIVFFKDMSMQMTGVTKEEIDSFWNTRDTTSDRPPAEGQTAISGDTQPLFDRERILAFAVGNPSQAFGKPYEIFDEKRKIARLPGPPYCFMDRVVKVDHEPWVLAPGGWVEAQYDVPANAWYFGADGSGVMPYCVLLEIALQPCGWLAAYAGSALKSQTDLKFRNLGGQARVHDHVIPASQTLTMRTRMTKVSEAADMIIENFDFEVLSGTQKIFSGQTYFGFFSAKALAQQVGLRESVYQPQHSEISEQRVEPLALTAPWRPEDVPTDTHFQPQGLKMPSKALLMLDGLEAAHSEGGPDGLGFYRGYKMVDPQEWFFKAHFYQDPVCPGSLGIESFLQLLKWAALQRWPHLKSTHRFEMIGPQDHQWSYRGQVIPTNTKVVVDAVITQVQEGINPLLMANGSLQVDGIPIYKMEAFGLRLVAIT